MKRKKTVSKSLSQLKKELDRVFSIFIRRRDKGICYTCGDKKLWKYQQNGHYVSRSYLSLRFDERNCHCQCAGCNVFKHGNMDEYAIKLKKEYGETVLDELNREKWKSVKYDRQWYEEKIAYYKNAIWERWKHKV